MRVAVRRRRPAHGLAACGFFRGEVPYIREWIEFHRLVGFDHFYMLDNDPDPASAEVVRPYVDLGVATLIPWPGGPAVARQLAGYAQVCHLADARWVAFLDLDEFLVPIDGDSVPAILHDYEWAPALAVNWLLYGNSGHLEPQPIQIDAYRRCAEPAYEGNRHVKCVVNPRLVTGLSSMHLFDFPTGFAAVDENGRPLSVGLNEPTHRRIRVNHYVTRSLADWRMKSAKWAANDPGERKGDEYFAYNNRNECCDEAACRFLPALMARLDHPPAR